MLKTPLYGKCKNYDFAKLFEEKGYTWYSKGEYNLNIIGVRADNNNVVTNVYDDVLVVDYNTPVAHKRAMFTIATEPGRYYMANPIAAKGSAILVPGQYKSCWQIAKHKGLYKALCQCKPVKVYRDNNRDMVYDLDPKTEETGMFGINIHRSNEEYVPANVDKYSAGCQVFADSKEFAVFMNLCTKQMLQYGNKFTYTLLDEKDLV